MIMKTMQKVLKKHFNKKLKMQYITKMKVQVNKLKQNSKHLQGQS